MNILSNFLSQHNHQKGAHYFIFDESFLVNMLMTPKMMVTENYHSFMLQAMAAEGDTSKNHHNFDADNYTSAEANLAHRHCDKGESLPGPLFLLIKLVQGGKFESQELGRVSARHSHIIISVTLNYDTFWNPDWGDSNLEQLVEKLWTLCYAPINMNKQSRAYYQILKTRKCYSQIGHFEAFSKPKK